LILEILSSCAVWTKPLIQDGRFYTSAGVSTGLNLSWAMISGRLWRLRSGIARHPVTAPFGAMLQTWPGPLPAPGASKVVMVCADIGMEIARATRMVAAGWSFLFAK
jgi:hypothetical protein